MHKALHPRDDVENHMCQEKNGGRKLISIEDIVDASIQPYDNYIKKVVVSIFLVVFTKKNTDNTRINRMEITRKQKWEYKKTLWRF